MSSVTESNLGLNYGWAYGESSWNTGMDDNLVKLGFTSRNQVKGILSAPPSTPTNGDAYIVGTSPTGLFSGNFGKVAIWDRTVWLFLTPKNHEVVYNAADGCDYKYDNGWVLKQDGELSPYVKVKDFTFSTGYTITDQRQCLLNLADNKYYQWFGGLPKIVPAGSTPATAGGIGVGLWADRSDLTLRAQLASSEPSFYDSVLQARYLARRVCASWFKSSVTSKGDPQDESTWDWSPAILAAQEALISAFGGGELIVDAPAIILTSIGVKTNIVKLTFLGTTITVTSGTEAGAIYVIQTEPDINKRPAMNRKNPISGFRMFGPSNSGNGVVLRENTSPYGVTSVVLSNYAIHGFENKVVLSDGAFHCTSRDFDFSDVNGLTSTNDVYIPAGTNCGENNSFIAGRFAGVGTSIKQENGNASTNVIACSFNYSNEFVDCSAGTVSIIGGHAEAHDTGSYKYSATDTGLITVTSQDQLITSNLSVSWGYSSDDNLTGGLHFSKCRVGNITQTSPVKLIAGNGNQSLDVYVYEVTGQYLASDRLNVIRDGAFASASSLSNWTLSSPPPVWNGSAGRLAVGCAEFTYGSGIASSMTQAFAAAPGDKWQVSAWAYTSGTDAGRIYGTVTFAGPGSETLAEYAFMDITNGTSGQWVSRALAVPPAPPGTAKVSISLSTFGFSVAGAAFIDEVVLSRY